MPVIDMLSKASRLAVLAALALGTTALQAAVAQAATLEDLSSLQIVGNVPFRQQLDVAAKTGFTHVRFGLRWNQIEKQKGKFDWAETDSKFDLVKKAGLTPIVTIFGNHGAYQPKTDKEQPAPSTDAAVKGYAAFAAAIAERYGTELSGRPIHYEIWNEPNTKTFWRPMPNPEDYARLAGAACKAIRAVQPEASILGLGMEGTPVKQAYFVRDYNIDIYQEWARRATADGEIAACASGFSMHPYRKVPETYIEQEAALSDFIQGSWKGKGQPLIVNSEWGVSSAKSDEIRQAAMDLRILLVGAGSGRLTNIYQAISGGKNESDESVAFGITTLDGREKPAAAAFRRLFSLVGKYEVGKLSTIADGVYTLELSPAGAAEGSGPARIVWSAKPVSGPLPPGIAGRDVKAVDLVTGDEKAGLSSLADITEAPLLLRQ